MPSATEPKHSSEGEFEIEAYRQNFETFRSLNTLFWQIPLIAMTLTGGLWFGVSTVLSEPWFGRGLLALAALGNFGLVIVLNRLRYIMGRYLDWLDGAYPLGFVSAKGDCWVTRSRTVQIVFSVLMACAGLFSLFLIFV